MRGRPPPALLQLLALAPALAALSVVAAAAANTSAAVSPHQNQTPSTGPGTARAPAAGTITSLASAASTAATATVTSTAKTTAPRPTATAGMPCTSAAASSPRPAPSGDQGLTPSPGTRSPALPTTAAPTSPANVTSATAARLLLPRASAAVRQSPVPPIHLVSGPLIDDEDPPLPQPPSPADEDLPLIPSWSNRNGPEPDDNMDVRSSSPRGGRAPPVDLHQEAAAATPAAADDEAQGQAHPAWHLVNARRCGLSKNPFSDRIVGGAMAALGQYPWLVRMGYNLDDVPRRVYRCAGAVITHLHVLTAAHCVKNLPQNFEFAGVRLGEWDTTTDPDCQTSVCAPAVYDVDPESVIVHQDYNNPRFANDIALVKLAQKLSFNGWVAPVCIPYGDLLTKSFESERTEVAGWGIYDINLQKSSQELRMVHLPVVSNSICHALYRNQANITKKQMCAGGELGSDACSGDSGGPLLRVEAYGGGPRYYIVGIVSFGSRRCGLTPAPGVYTRVSYYIDWILDNIEQT